MSHTVTTRCHTP